MLRGHFWVPLSESTPHIAVASQLEMQVAALEFRQLYGVNPHFPSYRPLSAYCLRIEGDILTELQQLPSTQGTPGPHCTATSLT